VNLVQLKRAEDAAELALSVEEVFDLGNAWAVGFFNNKFPDLIFEAEMCQPKDESISRLLNLSNDKDNETSFELGLSLSRNGFMGLLMKASIAMRSWDDESTFHTNGHFHCFVVYGDTYEAAWERAVVVAEGLHAKSLSRFKRRRRRALAKSKEVAL
jgi:hypothetical protein